MEEKTLQNVFQRMEKLKVLLIGETILDEYCFVNAVGRATKDPVLVTHLSHSEMYAGGVIATARHLANFVDEVQVITILGTEDEHEQFVKDKVPNNVKLAFFKRKNGKTIIKRAYVDPTRNNKLFKVTQLDERRLEDDECKLFESLISKYENDADLILVNDFGHEFIDHRIAQRLEKSPKFLGINVQTNSANYGFNLVTKYARADFVSMNQTEIKLFFHRKDRDFDSMFADFVKNKQYEEILLTLGKDGCLFNRTKTIHTPAFVTKPVDTIGAGDATFAIAGIATFVKAPEEVVSLIASAAGAAATEYSGNKGSVGPEDIKRFVLSKNT